MCELLGISVSPAAKLGLYLKAFRPRAADNVSGWGVGWYEGTKAHVVKEPVRADQSDLAMQLQDDPPTSSTFLVHVRAATIGNISLHNTHPFVQELNNKSWLFAHNGTINNIEFLPRGDFVAAGETDSEAAFHYILTALSKCSSPNEELDAITAAAAELSRNGRANFLLSDGETLYVHYDGHKTLHVLERQPGISNSRFEGSDADYSIDLDAEGPERVIVCASVPLTTDGWTAMQRGEMLVCRGGEVAQRVKVGPGSAYV
ncbi:MAG: class II glutamine amidotransferase [Actinomycetota bacterium]|nr:class II glutamine amidotransferase [Actinomycetota bacterium]